jgi:hypothetical protein
MKFFYFLFFVFLISCSSPSASSVCQDAEFQNLVSECQKITPRYYSVLAVEQYQASIKNYPEKKCFFMSFDREYRYKLTLEAYENVSKFSGPYRYGNEKKMIFVWCEKEMLKGDAQNIETIIKNL